MDQQNYDIKAERLSQQLWSNDNACNEILNKLNEIIWILSNYWNSSLKNMNNKYDVLKQLIKLSGSSTHHISTSMPLHHPFPVVPRIKAVVLRFGTNSSRIKQYFCTLKYHCSSRLWKPLIPAYTYKDIDNQLPEKKVYIL